MRDVTRDALVSRLSDHDTVVEIGVGRQTDIAGALADSGATVIATDITTREVPPSVQFVTDDVTCPTRAIYRDAGLLYALNLPTELHVPVARLARSVDASFRFTTLGTDPPAIPVKPESIPGDTLYYADGTR